MAPPLSKPETQVSSWNLLLPYFPSQSNLLLLYLLNVSHIDSMFPYSYQHRINLYSYYTLLGSLSYPLCPLSITPPHLPTLILPKLCFQNKNQTKSIPQQKSLVFLCTLWNLQLFQWLSSDSLAEHSHPCSRRKDNTLPTLQDRLDKLMRCYVYVE